MVSPSASFLIAALCDPLPLERLRQLAGEVCDWDKVLALADRHDATPLLYRAIDSLGGAVPDDVHNRLRTRFAAQGLRSLQLDADRLRLTGLLLDAGIPVIPWKGPVLAALLYGDVTLRPCADIDLLVPTESAWRALEVLAGQGYDPGFPVPPSHWAALRRAVNYLALKQPGRQWLVELHWGFLHPMHVWSFDLSAHWAELVTGGAAREGRLTMEETLGLLCIHGTNHRWEQLKWVVDIDRLLRCTPDLDWDKVLVLAGRMGGRRALLLGLELARVACATPLPEAVALLISRDPYVARLSEEVQAVWFANPAERDILGEYLFHWRSRERCRDCLLWLTRQLFAPRLADWQTFPVGNRCYPLFYLERPLRMAWKWFFQPLPARLKSFCTSLRR